MQHPALRRTHAWLALTAMLLLALMPALGRLTGHAGQYGATPAMHGMHPSSSHAMRMTRQALAASGVHAASGNVRHGDTPGMPHSGHANEDCGYCLLTPTAPPATPALTGPAPLAGGLPWADGHAQVTTQQAPSPSLGSRGPPAA